MEERLPHKEEVAGSIPAPATNSEPRRWKNGQVVYKQHGRHDIPRMPPVVGGKAKIDLRFKAYRHLRASVKRDWKGRYHFPDGTIVDEFQYPSHRNAARRVVRTPGKYGAVAQPKQSRAHLVRDGVYIASGKRMGARGQVWGIRRKDAPVNVATKLSYQDADRLARLARDMGMAKNRLLQCAAIAFLDALEQSVAARKIIADREFARRRRAIDEHYGHTK